MYLVTGGCGFIGSHLVDLLIEQGYGVRVLDDLSNSSRINLSPHAEFLLGSVCDKNIWKKALKGVKGVFHLAALVSVYESIAHWHKAHLINCSGTVALLEIARDIPIIFASSAAIYGDSGHMPLHEELPPNPLSPYAVDKLACEMHARLAWQLYRTPSIAFRFFNVYGPRQNPLSSYSGVITKFANQIMRNEPLVIYGDGNQQRDFIYVQDIVSILSQAMETPFEGAHTYNLCTGKTYSINMLADLIGCITGRPVKKDYRPERCGEIRISHGDPVKIFKEKGLRAQMSLEQGLSLYLQNLKENS